jgi:hypothetical protein
LGTGDVNLIEALLVDSLGAGFLFLPETSGAAAERAIFAQVNLDPILAASRAVPYHPPAGRRIARIRVIKLERH